MSTITTSPENQYVTESVGGSASSAAEGIGGLAAVVLTILGLAHIVPDIMLSIATIAIGASLILEGGGIASAYSRILSKSVGSTAGTMEVGGGMTVEIMAGIAGVVLGILALLGFYTLILTASALIVYGAALILGSRMMSQVNDLRTETFNTLGNAHRLAHETVTAAVGAQTLVGLAAGVLGILALVRVVPTVLVLIGLLAVGSSLCLSGGAILSRLIGLRSR